MLCEPGFKEGHNPKSSPMVMDWLKEQPTKAQPAEPPARWGEEG